MADTEGATRETLLISFVNAAKGEALRADIASLREQNHRLLCPEGGVP